MSSEIQNLELGGWWTEVEPRLLQAARRYRPYDVARDLVQDVAVLAVTNQDRFTQAEDFFRWARARLHWLLLDRFDAERRRPTVSAEKAPEPAVASTQEQDLMAREIRSLIEELPGRQQAVLRGIIEGRSTSEIAAELQVTEATVRSLRRFGCRALAILLGAEVMK